MCCPIRFTADFDAHAKFLYMFVATLRSVNQPLWPPKQQQYNNNIHFVQTCLGKFLENKVPPNQINALVNGLFEQGLSLGQFKGVLRDFLVTLRQEKQ